MKNKKILIVLLLLIAVAVYFFMDQRSGTIREEYKNFAVKDTAEISRIFISTQKNEKADLQKIGNSDWRVNDRFKARQDAIDLLLETFYRIDVRSPVPESAFETIVKRMASSAVKVEIYQGGDYPEKVYYVGEATQNHHGTYMLLEVDGKKSSKPFITYVPGFYGYLSTRFFTEERLWRDRAIFSHKVSEIKSVKLDYSESPEKSFSINQSNGTFTIKDGQGNEIPNVDPATTREYLERYQSVHFEYVDIDTPDEQKDSILNSQPILTIELTDMNNEIKQLKAYYKPVAPETYDINTGELQTHNLDRCVGMIDDVDFVTIQYVTLDELLITATDIRNAVPVDKN